MVCKVFFIYRLAAGLLIVFHDEGEILAFLEPWL